MRTDGTNKSVIISGNISEFIVDGNDIFYMITDGDYGDIYKTSVSGKNKLKLAENAESFNVGDKWVYIGLKDKGVNKISKAGGKISKVGTLSATCEFISITNDWIHTIAYYEGNNDITADYLRFKTNGTGSVRIDNIFNKNAYADSKLYNKLYEKFNCKYLLGSFNYLKFFQLYHDYPRFANKDKIPNDERLITTFEGTISGRFGFYNDKKDQDKDMIDSAKKVLMINEKIEIKTNKGINAYYYYDKSRSWFRGVVMNGHFTYSIQLFFSDNSYDKYKNIIIDMLKSVDI